MNDLRLPKGWRWVRLEEVCFKPQYGYTAPAINKPNGPKLLRITDIQEGKVDPTKSPSTAKTSDRDRKGN